MDGQSLPRVIYVPDSEPNSAFVITAYDFVANQRCLSRRRRKIHP